MMACVVCVKSCRANWITNRCCCRCWRRGTHLIHLVAQFALQPRPLDGAHQRVAKVLAEQAIDVERNRVVDQLQQIGQCPEHLKRKAGQHLRGNGHVQYGHGRDAEQEQDRGAAEQQEQPSLLGKLARIIVLHVGGARQDHLTAALAGPAIDEHDAQIEASDHHGRHQLEDHLEHYLVHRVEDGALVDVVVPPEIHIHVVRGQHALDELAAKDARQVDDERHQAGDEDNHAGIRQMLAGIRLRVCRNAGMPDCSYSPWRTHYGSREARMADGHITLDGQHQ